MPLWQVARLRSRGHAPLLCAAPARSRNDQAESGQDHRRGGRLAVLARGEARARVSARELRIATRVRVARRGRQWEEGTRWLDMSVAFLRLFEPNCSPPFCLSNCFSWRWARSASWLWEKSDGAPAILC